MLQITPLRPADGGALARMLSVAQPGYIRHFHPFSFDEASIAQQLTQAKKDQYWGICWQDALIGFFMLRGFDEGYARPAFGVFIDEAFANKGLGSLALQYSLSWCKLNGVEKIMLKVHPENQYARRAYEQAGFVFCETCPQSGQLLMEKVLRLP
jgi:RimJ/RimL family protein N-acetyltransferase